MRHANKNRVQSVSKALAIVEAIAQNDGRMTLTRISEIVFIPTSTTYRLLSSLMELGYINQVKETGEYELGVKFLSLAGVVLRQMNLRQIAFPYLQELQIRTNETSNLVVLDSGEVLYVEKVESKQPIRAFSMIGHRAPVHATGAGKVLLAGLSSSKVTEILNRRGMEAYTDSTITDQETFLQELQQVRIQGYALDDEECEQGVVCIAAPVLNHIGRTVASMSVSGPCSRLSPKVLKEMVEPVKRVALDLSRKLGFVEGISMTSKDASV